MNTDLNHTAPFIRHSFNAFVIYAVREEHQVSHACTMTCSIVLATMRWRYYKPGFSWRVIQNLLCSWMSQCSMGCFALVGLGQSQGHGNGGHKQGGAGQNYSTSRPEYLPAVQWLDRSEVPNHWLSIVELELRECTQLEEQKINTNVKCVILLSQCFCRKHSAQWWNFFYTVQYLNIVATLLL